jgi:hypothetical protein
MVYSRQHFDAQTPITLVYEDVTTHCPSCETTSSFEYCGAQHFPPHAAAAANLPRTLYLFTCRACGSTLSHIDLDMMDDVG